MIKQRKPLPPPRDLYTAQRAEQVLGIPAALVRKWAFRRKLYPMGIEADGRHSYDKADLRALWDASPASRRVA